VALFPASFPCWELPVALALEVVKNADSFREDGFMA
jgi:hypothetical protein